jgi:hypothetical protein
MPVGIVSSGEAALSAEYVLALIVLALISWGEKFRVPGEAD